MYSFKVDKGSSRPIYLQIRDCLLEAIDQGLLLPGQKIPSARDLSEQMDVSRMTVLQALRDLSHQGRVYSVAGKGTFVSLPEKLEPNLRTVWGFTETFQSQGYELSSQLIHFDHIPADARAAEALQVPEKTILNRITRKRLLNDQPVGVETAHLVQADFPELNEYDWNLTSLYRVLRDRYCIELVGGRNYIEATAAADEIARYLSIPKRTPVLSTQRITYSANMRPVELVYAFYRGDRMRMMVEMIHENPVNILTSKLDHVGSNPNS